MAFTKYTGNITGEAGSLITALDAILVTGEGWAADYTGTNSSTYRAPSGVRHYLRVDDNGPGAGTYKEARIVGYEAMSDVDTGTGPFPTAAQAANGQFARKSATADATNRAYIAYADALTLYFFCATGDSANVYFAFGFGEYYSLLTGNNYRSFLCGRITENNNNATTDRLCSLVSALSTSHQFYVPRGYTGLGTAVAMSRVGDTARLGSASDYAGTIPYPNATDGGLYLTPITIGDPTTAPANHVAGRMRGIWAPLHPLASFNHGDTVTGTGDFAGKTFEVIKTVSGSGGAAGAAFIETSDTLETN